MDTIKKWILRIVQLVLLVVIIYSGYQIGSYYYDRYKAQKKFDETKEIVVAIKEEEIEAKEEEKLSDRERAEKIIKALQRKNEDIVAYISMEDTSIDYPVVYKDNDYYLRRGLDREYSLAGTIFLEEQNNPNFTDMNTVLYGHNMSNAIGDYAQMFAPILKLSNPDYVASKDNHFIEIITENGFYKYRVISAFFTHANYEYRNLNMDEKTWLNYLEDMKKDSDIDFNYKEDFKTTDRIITLSTCDNVTDMGRFAVVAILVEWSL